MRVTVGGVSERFDDCPASFVSYWVYGYLRKYNQYSKGNLWYPGSVSEQPNKYLRAMNIIDSQVSQNQTEEIEKSKRKNSKQRAPAPAPRQRLRMRG